MNPIKNYLIKHQHVRFFIKNLLGKGIVKNYYHTSYQKNALLMYVEAPFLSEEVNNAHQAYWQEIEIARILSKRGYNVDVIDYNNDLIHLNKDYDFVLDLIPGRNPVFRRHMAPGCKTVAYLTGSNATFQNQAERKRLDDLKKRRNVELMPRRQSPRLTKAIESYSACFMMGNEYNWKTYKEFNLGDPFYIRNTGFPQEYKFDRERKKANAFLFFGSSGQVHKGLDLLLEVFSEKDFPGELYVCGTFKSEKDFESCYRNELYNCKNIHAIGFVRIDSAEYKELTDICSYSIMPSCSEGQAGSVLTTMSSGLINVCSRECGFEDDEVIILDDCSIATIRDSVLQLINKSMDWIEGKSRQSYETVQTKYTKNDFINSVEKGLDGVLK